MRDFCFPKIVISKALKCQKVFGDHNLHEYFHLRGSPARAADYISFAGPVTNFGKSWVSGNKLSCRKVNKFLISPNN